MFGASGLAGAEISPCCAIPTGVSGPRTAAAGSASLSRAPRRNAAQFGFSDIDGTQGSAAGLDIRKVVLTHLAGLKVGTEEKSIFAVAYKKGIGHQGEHRDKSDQHIRTRCP